MEEGKETKLTVSVLIKNAKENKKAQDFFEAIKYDKNQQESVFVPEPQHSNKTLTHEDEAENWFYFYLLLVTLEYLRWNWFFILKLNRT